MKLQLLAAPLLVALMLSPMFAAAANGTISFSSPAAGASYTGTTAYTISGTITPTPTLPDNVVITVTLQGGVSPVDEQTVSVGAGGVFSYATNAGGSAAWVTGTYLISAFDSNGATGTTTFKYTASTTVTPSTGAVSVEAPSVLLTGQSANVYIWSSAPGTVTAWVLASGASSTTALTTSRVTLPAGEYLYSGTYATTATSATGAYLVYAAVANTTSGFSAAGVGAFTVNGGLATSANQATELTDLTTLTTNLAALQTTVTGIQTSVTALATSLTAIQTSVTGLGTSITGLGRNVTSGFASVNSAIAAVSTAVGNVNTAVGGVSSSLGSLTTTVNGISSSLTSLTNTVAGISSTLTSITSTLSAIQTSVGTLSGLSSQMTSLSSQVTTLSNSLSTTNSDVSNAQTYILVVAALVVITLVLELAILIRKLS